MASTRLALLFGLLWIGTFAVGCNNSRVEPVDGSGASAGIGGSPADGVGGSPADGFGGYVTDLPGPTGASPPGPGAGGAIAYGPQQPAPEDLQRVLAASDLTRIDGNRLYAFSRNAGLSVIDIADPSALRVLGTRRSAGWPVELYVGGSRLLELSNDPVQQAAYGAQITMTSRLEVLDVSAPSTIATLHEFSLKGTIVTHRRVGNFLYVVTSENACVNCGTVAVHVTSFDVSQLEQVAKAHELTLEAEAPTPQWDAPTLHVTASDARIFVTIDAKTHVVSLGAGGTLTKANELSFSGALAQGAPVNELSGTTRAFSQGGGNGPALDIFATTGAPGAPALAHLTLQLSSPQHLTAAAFDGTRAFALTSDGTSSTLTTLDVSDPASPVQRSSIGVSAELDRLEVRGARVLAWGGAPLKVLWFDVSDLTAPVPASQLTLSSSAPERIDWLVEDELLAVPFSGFQAPEECRKDFESGVQLVRIASDQLSLVGTAPGRGVARRAFVHDGTLFAVSDKQVRTFDISDESTPAALSHADIARSAAQVVPAGDKVLRLGQESWSDESTLDITNAADAEEPTALSELDLRALPSPASSTCALADWFGTTIVRGRYAYVSRFTSVDSGPNGPRIHPTLFVIDLDDPSALEVVFTLDLEAGEEDTHFLEPVATDSALLIGRTRSLYHYDPWTDVRIDTQLEYDVIDLSSPAEPSVASRFSLPSTVARGGFGYTIPGTASDGTRGRSTSFQMEKSVFLNGDVVLSQHEERADMGRVRYYLDRLDVSDPANPELLPPINIPGVVTGMASDGEHFTTLDYEVEEQAADSIEDCGFAGFVRFEDGNCLIYRRRAHSLRLTDEGARILDSQTLEVGDYRDSVSVIGGNLYTRRSGQLEIWRLDANRRFVPLTGVPAPGAITPVDGVPLIFGARTIWEVITNGSTPSTIEYPLRSNGCEPSVADGVLYCALGGLGAQRIELGAEP